MRSHKFVVLKSGNVWCSAVDPENQVGEYCGAGESHPIHHAMTDEQEEDLQLIKARFFARAEAKYRDGAAEHGGNVWDNVTLDELEDEIIDAYIYLWALRRKMSNVADRALEIHQRLTKDEK